MNDTVVLITGGTRGIGRQIVEKFAGRGVKIVFTYQQSSDLAASLVSDLQNRGIEAQAVQADTGDFTQAKMVIDKLLDRWDHLDVLVNNAGVIRDKTLLMMDREDWDTVLRTNLDGVFNLTRNAIFYMLKNKSGRIVNLSSISGIVGTAGQTNYSAAKAGIIGFTRALAKETAAYGIAVNAVAPGGVSTDMLASMSEKARTHMLQSIPAGRFCEPEEVAQVVEWLAFDSPLYLTGNVITLDGGAGIS